MRGLQDFVTETEKTFGWLNETNIVFTVYSLILNILVNINKYLWDSTNITILISSKLPPFCWQLSP